MRQVRVKVKPRLRRAEPADPPTVSEKIARVWFPEADQPTTREPASENRGSWLSGRGAGSLTARAM